MNILDGLNENQLKAVTTTDCHIRIVAGAGSGKTKVVTSRIAYLIEKLNIYPNRILAITFTNKAANEMKERVENTLGIKNSGVNISTIHSFCVRVLREDIRHFGYPTNFVILDSDDQKSILRDIYKKLDIDVKTLSYNQSLNYISNNKCALISAKDAELRITYEYEKLKLDVYKEYENSLNQLQALDFDDLLIFVYKLLRDNIEVRNKWQRRYDYIHVDEFQDVDELQYGITKYLVRDDAYLCVVGDPDQTIYTWRGAKIDIIMNFERDFKNTKSIILNQNYRSTANILNAANDLIKFNYNRVKKDLFTENDDDTKITYYNSNDEKFEALWIAKKIMVLKGEGIDYNQIAILYRSNYLSRNLEKVFFDAHIPYRIYGGVKFFERAEIKDALSYLRLLIKDNRTFSQLAIKRIINVPKRGIGLKTLENIEIMASTYDEDYFDAIKNHPVAKGKTQREIDKFVELIEEVRTMSDEYSISVLLKKLLEDSGYQKALEDAHEDERLENINELLSDINTYEENNPDGSLDDYLQMISLYTDAQDNKDNKYVQLMSVHAAKGLEFDNVFVYSLCEGIFPNEKSVSEGGESALEEERRLAYVAITRARKRLFLSSSQGYSFITNRMKTPSRFISEIGKEKLNNEGEIFDNYPKKENRYVDNSASSSKIDVSKLNANSLTTKKTKKLKKGDLISHTSFGEGVIINLKDGVATIAFDKKFGIKRIAANNAALSKK